MKTTTQRVGQPSGGAAVSVETIRTRLSPAKVRAIMANGVRAINGAGPDTYSFAKVFYGAIGYSLFSSIYNAFLAKSAHGRDELGFSWIDLKPETKAYKRMDAREGIPLPGPKYRPTLTKEQDKAWRGTFARIARKLNRSLTSKKQRSSMSRAKLDELRGKKRIQGQEIAAASAWIFVKEHMGAQPLIELCPPKKIPLLIDTERLVTSLEPAPLTGDGAYQPTNSDQVWRVKRAELTAGTRVPYAGYVDVRRPLWSGSISVWMDRAATAGRNAVAERLAEILRAG